MMGWGGAPGCVIGILKPMSVTGLFWNTAISDNKEQEVDVMAVRAVIWGSGDGAH